MIYNAYLAFKHRPRLSVWGKIVVWWVIVSLPWMLALAWYTVTGQFDDRFRPIATLSALISLVVGIAAPQLYDTECEELPKWRIFKERDE